MIFRLPGSPIAQTGLTRMPASLHRVAYGPDSPRNGPRGATMCVYIVAMWICIASMHVYIVAM